jgi:hypothetical protein
LLSCI